MELPSRRISNTFLSFLFRNVSPYLCGWWYTAGMICCNIWCWNSTPLLIICYKTGTKRERKQLYREGSSTITASSTGNTFLFDHWKSIVWWYDKLINLKTYYSLLSLKVNIVKKVHDLLTDDHKSKEISRSVRQYLSHQGNYFQMRIEESDLHLFAEYRPPIATNCLRY